MYISEEFWKKVVHAAGILLNLLAFLVVISLPIYLLYRWNFSYADKILEFLKADLWPLVVLVGILLFRQNIAKFMDEASELVGPGWSAKRNPLPLVQEEVKELEPSPVSEDVVQLKKIIAEKDQFLNFEWIYNIIFESQLVLIRHLRVARNMTIEEISNYFSVLQTKWPLLKQWTTDYYLKFLLDNGLIEQSLTGYIITVKGDSFISYIDDTMKYIRGTKNL